MDFELTKSQKEILKAAKEFAKGEFAKELALELDRTHEFPTKIWQKAADLGFIGIHYPEEYSGQGLGVLENIIIADAFCAQDSGIGSAVILSSFASECILRFGSEELKQKFLPAVAEGEITPQTNPVICPFWIVRKGNTRSRISVKVTIDHSLDGYCCTPIVRNPHDFPILSGLLTIP